MTVKFIISDTETVGLHPPPAPASGVVEVAYLELDMNTLEILDEGYSRVQPGCPIHPEASKVHGISDADVIHAPKLGEVYKFEDAVIHSGHNCVTGDHEILTRDGWVRFDALRGSTVEAAVWDGGEVRFSESLIVRNPHNGDMLEWDTEFHCGKYTPEHTMVYSKTRHLLGGGAPVWEKATADEYSTFGPNSVAIPAAGVYAGGGGLQLSEAEARVLEMVRADGNIEPRGAIRLKFSKPRKVLRAKALLDAVGVPYSEHPANSGSTRIAILQCALRQRICDLFREGKHYGPWVLELTAEARAAIVDELQHWDGHKTSREDNKCQVSVLSVYEQDLDWIQTLSLLSGKASRRFDMAPNTGGFSTGRLIGKVNARARSYVKTLQKPVKVTHSGLVYCLTTSSGAFLVRRRGVAWITGNCSFDLKFLAGQYDNLIGSLCTLALARQYIHDSPNHKLGTLVDHLGLQKGQAHNALADCHMTRHLLIHIIEKSGRDLKAHIAAARKPKILHVLPFGKYKGQKIATLPRWYIDYFADKEIDPDLRYSFDQALKMRL
jgi:DNA polymerase III epsilon subunit-like protein